MSDYPYRAETDGVCVEVMPRFLPEQSDSDRENYVWAYDVRITNLGERTVQLTERLWTITDGNGRSERVQGPGVVGEQPILNPGDRFEYTSGCPLGTPSGIMRGSYTMVGEDGSSFEATIPAFSLDSPNGARVLN